MMACCVCGLPEGAPHGQNAAQGRFAGKNLRCVWQEIRLAQEMGFGMGRSAVLLGGMPA
jgi:hypothetical protein